jgi:hypothetical protein
MTRKPTMTQQTTGNNPACDLLRVMARPSF